MFWIVYIVGVNNNRNYWTIYLLSSLSIFGYCLHPHLLTRKSDFCISRASEQLGLIQKNFSTYHASCNHNREKLNWDLWNIKCIRTQTAHSFHTVNIRCNANDNLITLSSPMSKCGEKILKKNTYNYWWELALRMSYKNFEKKPWLAITYYFWTEITSSQYW